MNNVQRAIFPGIVVGCLIMVMFIRIVAKPDLVLAAGSPLTNSAHASFVQDQQQNVNAPGLEVQSEATESQPANACSLGGQVPASVLQWCDAIEQHAADNGLPVTLLAALITQESNGDTSAYSNSGAVGLMQIMPRDGIAAGFMCISGPCFSDRPSINELYDPDYNLAYGSKMLAGLIQKYGNLRDALKAYGPMDRGYEYADTVLRIYENYQ